MPLNTKLIENKGIITATEFTGNLFENCTICPHECAVNRKTSKSGFCRSGVNAIVSAYTPHFGEEPVLSGANGVGNIFFGNCNLRCVYCQNFEISQPNNSACHNEVSIEKLAEIMLELQVAKCHSIGLVSPTHFAPQIIQSLSIAKYNGLNLPLIYNTNAYDKTETLKLLQNSIDIYLPDFKYGSNKIGFELSGISDYFDIACKSIKEMYEQVGSKLVYDGDIITKGLIIRHLVLPNKLAETEKILSYISSELSPDVHVSIMAQYYPEFRAKQKKALNRTITIEEYDEVLDLLDKYGIENGWVQELGSSENYKPEFLKNPKNPFNNANVMGQSN